MRALFDVNLLLALLDPNHVDHRRAHAWLETDLADGWASCPITQNGFVRVISQPRYPSSRTPSEAIERLAEAVRDDRHEFWACDVSMLDPALIDRSRLHGTRQVTDAYLIALATAHGGRFVTFDQAISLSAVPGATAANLFVL